MSFKQFLSESILTNKVFVCLIPSEKTKIKLDAFCKQNALTHTLDYDGEKLIRPFDYHLTIFYSNSNADISEGITHIDPCVVNPKSITFFGDNKDIPVILTDISEELLAIRNFYEKVWGLKSSFPNFTPHVSLSYDKNLERLKVIPDFPLVFDKIFVEIK